MKEYIEREAALEIINSLNIASALYAGRKIINLPSADVAPVRHGRWIMHDDEFGLTCECSACHIETMGDGNYCPNCGCRMDGGDDE